MLTKKFTFSDDVLDILKNMKWSDDGKIGVLTETLDRKMYVEVNKALEAMGGKWDRKSKCHVFSEDPRQQVSELLISGKLTVDRDGFFRTPHDIVVKMINLIGLPENCTILEPSAGDGAIADVLSKTNIYCVEQNEKRAMILKQKGYPVYHGDFLQMMPIGRYYDRIFMNPPFEFGQDIDHVMHAYKFLNENGKMAAIMSEGPFFRDDNKSKNFREWLNEVGGISRKLPECSFKESGTRVNTRIVIIEK